VRNAPLATALTLEKPQESPAGHERIVQSCRQNLCRLYPQAWPTHIQWAAMLLVLLCRGAGTLSLDALIERFWVRSEDTPQ